MRGTKKGALARRREILASYIFLLPNLLGFILFTAFPVLYGFFLSFTDYSGFNSIHFVGLENYQRLFWDDNVTTALKNNFLYTFAMVPLTILFALAIAVMIHFGIRHFRETFKMLVFLPNITSAIAIAIIWKQLFHPANGPINVCLKLLGIQNPPGWITSSDWALLSVIIVSVWQSIGINTILLLAGLQGIPTELYDAAEVDGAMGWKKFTRVTLPLLTPTTFFVIIMTTINSFKVFEVVFQMTNGGPGRATIVIVYRIYKEAFASLHYGYASAQAYLLFLIIFVFTVLQFWLQKRWVHYND